MNEPFKNDKYGQRLPLMDNSLPFTCVFTFKYNRGIIQRIYNNGNMFIHKKIPLAPNKNSGLPKLF